MHIQNITHKGAFVFTGRLNMRGLYILPLLLIQIILSIACSKEEIPAYIEVKSLEVIPHPLSPETAINIPDFWLFVDDDFRGIYHLPAKLPHLAFGNKKIEIGAGIKKNGIANSRVQYPFYKTFVQEGVDLFSGEEVLIEPVFSYIDGLTFAVNEGFEDVNIEFSPSPNSSANLVREDRLEFLKFGNFYGAIRLSRNDTNKFYSGVTNPMILPKNGRQVWLELDYACNNQLEIGITVNNFGGTSRYQPIIFLNPTNRTGKMEWNKIYIDFTAAVSGNVQAEAYQLVFTVNIDQDRLDADVLLDNINLIHRGL